MSKILITGSNGALGSMISKIGDHTIFRTTLQEVNLTDKVAVKDMLAEIKPEVIIHLASLLGATCEENPDLAKKVNVDATVYLFKTAVEFGLKRFIFTSSSAVYHQKTLKQTKENENIKPKTEYGITKLMAEQCLLAENKKAGIELVILRIFNIYGKGFENSLINKLVSGRRVEADVPKMFYRDYIYAPDVVGIIKEAVDVKLSECETIVNVGTGRAINTRDLVRYLSSCGVVMDYHVNHTGYSSYDVTWANIDRLSKQFKSKPRTDIILK